MMQSNNESLNRAWESLFKYDNLGQALHQLAEVASQHPTLLARPEYVHIREDYQLMRKYMLRGYRDEQRTEVYLQLCDRLMALVHDIVLEWNTQDVHHAWGAARVRCAGINMAHDIVRENLERFVQNQAMLSLEPEEVASKKSHALYSAHADYIERLFSAILVSKMWNEDDALFYTSLLLSPTVDVNDAQILITAVMLAASQYYDGNKLLTLMRVYRGATEERIRQRALVGWAFALPAEQHRMPKLLADEFSKVMADERTEAEMVELQEQLVLCMNAREDQECMEREILPGLLRNSNLRMTRFGLEEKEDDEMEDILNPDAADKRIEQIEKSMQRMMDMQKKGADLYYGSFSTMKRYPFFNHTVNWFTPFYIEYPDLQPCISRIGGRDVVARITDNGPLCDSDKYSFIFSLSNIIDQFSLNLRELLKDRGSAPNMLSNEEMNTPTFLRRAYLQDLYRFYFVSPFRVEFKNPFVITAKDKPWLTVAKPCSKFHRKSLLHLAVFFMQRKRYEHAKWLLEHIDHSLDDAEVCLLLASNSMKLNDYSAAVGHLERIPNEQRSPKAWRLLAHAQFHLANYAAAERAFQQVVRLGDGSVKLQQSIAVCKIKQGDCEGGLTLLQRLSFEDSENENVKRTMAWAYLMLGQPDKADAVYDYLIASPRRVPGDCLNAGYAKWALGQVDEAVILFQQYLQNAAGKDKTVISRDFDADSQLLDANHISKVDRMIMDDLVNQLNKL